MSLFTASLNSGSNGNCYYIGNHREAVLVDCGISNREVMRRLKRLALSIEKVKAIFLTHEHNDHVVGAAGVSHKHQIPVYISAGTRPHFDFGIDEKLIRIYEPEIEIKFDQLSVICSPKQHDALDAHNVMVTNGCVRVGVFTDLGKPCHHTIRYFKQCHAAFLESNYDEDMLERGWYSPALKDRVRGNYGHLSNKQALKLFVDHRPSFMSHLFLSHLSRHNNREEMVQSLFAPYAKEIKIIIASRKKETDLFKIGEDEMEQLRLFG
ncbi:MAG: MBL fold metallo-hydrolase [Bacteroidetes bacterium]|nr:MBL fold metallo-hydrolase [Bacteroidota bacterium]